MPTPPRFDFDHVPVTFAAYFVEQIRAWDTLFPAEQDYFARLSAFIEKAPPELFTPLAQLEPRMGVTPRTWPRGGFSLEHVDFLNRNALYPEWRRQVSAVFDYISPALDAAIESKTRLVVVLSPAELPVGPERMWTRLKGRRIALTAPDDILQLTGRGTKSLPNLCATTRGQHSSWTIETGESLHSINSGGTSVSYEKLIPYRQRLLAEIRKINEQGNIRGPRELGAKLKTLQPQGSEYSTDQVMGEFIRSTLLAGNGTLLFNNTFVEWATVQALRRARPSCLIASFGIRNKVKPFSSLLIFDDQEQSTTIPTQADMLGSYVDLEVFYLYIWQEALKYAEYRDRTAFLFLAEGMDEMLLIAPDSFPLPNAKPTLDALHVACRKWLSV
jgi:hypothetical protein